MCKYLGGITLGLVLSFLNLFSLPNFFFFGLVGFCPSSVNLYVSALVKLLYGFPLLAQKDFFVCSFQKAFSGKFFNSTEKLN